MTATPHLIDRETTGFDHFEVSVAAAMPITDVLSALSSTDAGLATPEAR
ncbi:hypothetical protein ACIHDR_19230 [Nocardia sp. NPDC052278]